MLRLTRTRFQSWGLGKHPEVHRHAQSTFHEGAHREPPKPSRTPWKDRMDPGSFMKIIILGPGTRISPWFPTALLALVSYYTVCLSFDIKAHYLMNNNLHRDLHLQRSKNEEMEQRCAQLENALGVRVTASGGDATSTSSSAASDSSSSSSTTAAAAAAVSTSSSEKSENATSSDSNSDSSEYVATNYEFELARERQRAKELHQQHQGLVHELADVRAENGRLKKTLENSIKEAENLRNAVHRLQSSIDRS